MYISRSLLALASILSFSLYVDARVAQHLEDRTDDGAAKREEAENNGFLQRWPLPNIFGKRQSNGTELDWTTTDLYLNILDDGAAGDIQTFCNIWLGLGPATSVVDYTPTITVTTSGASTTVVMATTRVVTTETVTASATAPAIKPRAVAAAYAVASQIITDVIENGSSDVVTAPAVAVTGLSQACSIKNVDPTATVTSTFTAPATKTYGKNKLNIVTRVSTKMYTTYTTVTPGDSAASSPTSSPSATVLSSNSQLHNSGPQAITSVDSTAITSGPSFSLLSSGTVLPTSVPAADSSLPVVIGIPFTCPNGDKTHPRVIVGDLQYEYYVLCDTAFVTDTAVTTIENVESEFACAAECSLINSAAHKDICTSASFTPLPGAGSGSCFISGRTSNFIPQPGTTTILLTGMSSKADDCDPVTLLSGPSNATINTQALVASVTSASFSLSTPGLLSRSQTGGVYTTYYSSGTTGTDGIYRYTWFQVYKSYSAWWEIYGSTWSCSAGVPQTIAVPALTTSGSAVFTTAFSTAFTSAVAGSGVESPGAAVTPVSTIVGTGAFTVSSETATFNSTGGFGIVLPSSIAGSLQSAINSAVEANATTVPPPGSPVFTISGETSTVDSTGGGGIGALSQSAGAVEVTVSGATLAVSGATSTSNSTGGAGTGVPALPTTSAELTVLGATSTSNSTGGAGTVGPVLPTNSAEITVSGATSTSNSTGGAGTGAPATLPTTSAELTISGAISTSNSTDGAGTGVQRLPTEPLELTVSGATSTSNSTGGSGTGAPATLPTISVELTVSGATSTSNSTGGARTGVQTLPTISAQLTISGATSTSNSTGGAGIGTGPQSQPTTVVETTISGAIFTVSGETSTANFTGGAGVASPTEITVPVELVTISTLASGTAPATETVGVVLTLSGANSTSNSTAGAGTAPPPMTTVAGELTVSGSTLTSNTTGGAGSGSPPPFQTTNGLELMLPSPPPTGTAPVISGMSFPAISNVTLVGTLSGATITLNLTAAVGTEAPTTSPEEVVTIPVTDVSPEDNGGYAAYTATFAAEQFPTESETLTISSTESIGSVETVPVTLNNTLQPTAPLGPLTTAISGAVFTLNSTSGTGIAIGAAPPTSTSENFSNTEGDRRGSLRSTPTISPTSGSPNSTFPGATAPTSGPSGVIVSPPANLTATAPASVTPSPSFNVTDTGGAIFPTLGTIALTSVAAGSGATTPLVNTTETPIASLSPSPSLNGTVPTGTGATTISGETTAISLASGSGAAVPSVNVTESPIPSLASLTPSPSMNASTTPSGTAPVSITTGEAISLSPSASLNMTTPASLVPTQSANTTSPFTNTEGDRFGSLLPTSASNNTAPGTGTIGTVTSAPISLNSTTAPATAPSVFTTNFGYGDITFEIASETPSETPSGISSTPLSLNITSTVGTAQPSVTIPPVSSNSTTSIPISNSTGSLSPEEADRLGRTRSRPSSGLSSASVAPTSNTTLPGTAPPLTAVSAVPTESANSSIPVSMGTSVPSGLNSTELPVGTAPIPANTTMPFSTGSVPSSSIPMSSANSSAPIGTASEAIPTPPLFTGASASAVPAPSMNSTIPFSTGTAATPTESTPLDSADRTGGLLTGASVSGLPTPSMNSTIPEASASGVPTPSINSTIPVESASGAPTPSMNSTIPFSTGTAATPTESIPLDSADRTGGLLTGASASGVPTPSTNFTIPFSTGTAPIPSGSVTVPIYTSNRTGGFLTGVTAPSSSVPTASANISLPVGTGSSAIPVASANITSLFLTGVPSPSYTPTPSANVTTPQASTAVAPITGNLTSILPTMVGTGSTGFPIPSSNATLPPSLLSATPTACPTEVSYSTVLHTTVITELVPIGHSSCVSSGLAPSTLNGTLPTGTALTALPASAFTASFSAATASPSAAPPRRRQGEVATQAEIDYACADSTNPVVNPDFMFGSGDTAVGWTIAPEDAYISFRTGPARSPNGTAIRSAQILSGAPGRSIEISQPITLCPGRKYDVSSFNRQANLLSKCTIKVSYGDNDIYTSSPQENFTERAEEYTAGTTPADVSKDARITVKCDGEGGALVGANSDGFMMAEFYGIDFMPVLEG